MAEKMFGQEESREDEPACGESLCVRPHQLCVPLLFHSVRQWWEREPFLPSFLPSYFLPSFLLHGFISAFLSAHLTGSFALFPKLALLWLPSVCMFACALVCIHGCVTACAYACEPDCVCVVVLLAVRYIDLTRLTHSTTSVTPAWMLPASSPPLVLTLPVMQLHAPGFGFPPGSC